ncbi:NUMOD4 domain-containing protein [Liquorilactobacillus satsumensis]|uniref:NUMOD4 domain-containing protein n=1 Tax=Liquorilactobacillus satsumensis TaxID=259059 RepID=UPI00345DFC14
MKKEIWKSIKGYEDLYEISNLGRVKSLEKKFLIPHHGKMEMAIRREKILKQSRNADGYMQVYLCRNKNQKTMMVHRLELSSFSGTPYKNNLQVNHLNEKTDDNRLENLEWCTPSYNINYGSRNKRVSKKNSKRVIATNIDTKSNKIFESVLQASKKLGLQNSHICECANGKRFTTGNYKFEYVN